MKYWKRTHRLLIVVGLLFSWQAWAEPVPPDVREVMPAIFKVHVVSYRFDYEQPWQGGGSTSGTGSAFLIDEGRLLTCGHVVADAISIEVQPNGSGQRFPAHVRYMGYDSDLAILELEDPSVLEGLPVMALADQMSELGDEVYAIGYPMGGSRLSLTLGIVSRLDHSVYAFSGVDERLVMQIDAAINPGNSGGPVVNDKNRVVGVAFQGVRQAQSLGYVVPVPVIRHFLADTAEAPYHGYPQIYLQTFELRNPALRASLGLGEDDAGGVAITDISRFCVSAEYLQPGDVLLAVDGVPIQQDGTIAMGENVLPFFELVERKQWGESLRFKLLRDGKHMEVSFPLTPDPHPFAYRRLYDRQPEYLITSGLCFMPLSRNYLMTLGRESSDALIPILYYFQRAAFDASLEDRTQVIAVTAILPHPVNTYADAYKYQVIREVNDMAIGDMEDLQAALAKPVDGYHILQFEALDTPLVLDADTLAAANAEIQQRYGIRALDAIRTE